MKKIRILCLVLAVIMILPFAASCAKSSKVYSNVTLIFKAPVDNFDKDDPQYDILFELDLKVEGTTKDMPTVLKAAEQALTEYEQDYELSKDGTYIASAFGRTESDSADSETGYFSFWEVFINGKKSNAGRQSVTAIYNEDEIVYVWTSDSKPRQDTDAVVTTNPDDDTTAPDLDTDPIDNGEEEFD